MPCSPRCCTRSFGNEDNDNGTKLTAFIDAVNSGDNSHLVTVPAGTILSDQLFGWESALCCAFRLWQVCSILLRFKLVVSHWPL